MSMEDLNKTKDLVKAWIRNPNKLPNIPDTITALCIIYYYIKEKFIKSGDCIKIIERSTSTMMLPLTLSLLCFFFLVLKK